jgi:hypothetical protein
MTTLQKIVSKAKAMKKAHPKKYVKWTDYIKAASKVIKPAVKKKVIKGLDSVKRSGNKKSVNYTKHTPAKKTVKQGALFGVNKKLGELFDTTIIKDIDSLKKQYFKLAKKYHPDSGGTTVQFQHLQSEYEKLLKSLLNGSSFTTGQKENELELDKAMRHIVDSLISIENINIELIGKWLWISGNTYPIRAILKSVGLIFIKKDAVPYWVYKGVESYSRGGTSMEDIKKKYGSSKIEKPSIKKLSGVGSISASNKIKLKFALKRAIKALNKRPI